MTTIPIDVSAIIDGSTDSALPVATALQAIMGGIEDTIDGVYPFDNLVFTGATTATIVADTLTCTQTRHRVATEGGVASDTVTTISAQADILLLTLAVPSASITFKHGTGNIYFDSGRDFILNSQQPVLVLYRNSTLNIFSSNHENLGSIFLSAPVDRTIASGAITATQSRMQLLPESGTADTLTSISNPNGLDMIVLSVKTAGHTITFEHDGVGGNIWIANTADIAISNQDQLLVLFWNDATSTWSTTLATSTGTLNYTDVLGNAGVFDTLGLVPGLYTLPGNNTLRLEAMPRFANRRLFWDEVQTGTTFVSFGLSMTNQGTASAQVNANSAYVRLTSTATIGNFASRRSSGTPFQWRWSPIYEAVLESVGPGTDLANEPSFFGLLSGGPAVAAGPVVTWTGVTAVLIRPYTSGGLYWVGQVYQSGTLLGETFFGTINPGSIQNKLRIVIDGVDNTVVFEANGERSSELSVTVGALATANLDLYAGRAARIASAITLDISRMYGEQN